MCAPISSTGYKSNYNEKEYNAERQAVSEENMSIKGTLKEDEDIKVFSKANNDVVTLSTTSAYSHKPEPLWLLDLIVAFLKLIFGDSFEEPESEEVELEESEDDETEVEGDQDGNPDKDAKDTDDEEFEDDVDADVSEDVNEDIDSSENKTSLKDIAEKIKNTVVSIASKTKAAFLNNQAVKSFENHFKNLIPKSVINNIASNLMAEIRYKNQVSMEKLKHPFKDAKNKFKASTFALLHPIQDAKMRTQASMDKVSFMFHQQKDPSEMYDKSTIRETASGKLGAKLDATTEKLNSDEGQKMKESHEIRQAAIERKAELSEERSANYDRITELKEKMEEFRNEHGAKYKERTAEQNKEYNAMKQEKQDLYDRNAQIKTEIDDLNTKIYDETMTKEDKAYVELSTLKDGLEDALGKLNTEGYTPSITELSNMNKMYNANLDPMKEETDNKQKQPEKLYLLDGASGASGFLKSAFEHEVRDVAEHRSELENKIDEMEKHSVEISDLGLLEIGSQACSLMKEWDMSDLANSYQVKIVTRFEMKQDMSDLMDFNKELKEDRDELKKQVSDFKDSHDMSKLSKEDREEYQDLKLELTEIREAISNIFEINDGFKSVEDDNGSGTKNADAKKAKDIAFSG